MNVKACLLSIALASATPAIAQPADRVDEARCKAEEAALERDIELARSMGRMLRRRQLAEALAALQARCSPQENRSARIEALEQEIRQLRMQLDRAETELRSLKAAGS